MAPATKEVAKREAAPMEATPEQIEQAYAAIRGEAELPSAGDPEVVSQAIMERIIAAESFEEVFQPQELEAWRELLDVPVTVRSFHLNPSGFEGSHVYAVVDLVRMDDGEAQSVTCGGLNVLTQLVKALEKGWLDRPVKMIAKPTREGFNALWLVAA